MRVLLTADERFPDHALTENLAEDDFGTVLELRPSELVAYRMAVKDYEQWQQRLADPAWIAEHQVPEPAP